MGECDIVLKGGMTSGVLYPALLAKLAERFRFRRLGGSSAGAIGAAFAAAAEYGRSQGNPRSFESLRNISTELAQPKKLGALFTPDEITQDLYRDIMTLMQPRRAFRPLSALRRFRIASSLLMSENSLKPWLLNGLGLCTGMMSGIEGTALTPWINTRINELAGIGLEQVLTFGMLESAPSPIELRLVATALELGKKLELPLEDHRIAFDPVQFRKLFPESVVCHMIKHANTKRVAFLPSVLLPLPKIEHLPVIVSVRMSMAFPGLFTPVPVHIPDPLHRGRYVQIHIADGGVTSNLPSTLFDDPLPIRPMFVVNLRYSKERGRHQRSGVDESGVWMPRSEGDGNVDLIESIDMRSGRSALIGVAKSVIAASMNWSDNRWLRLPGYRDRIVEVWLEPDEGGLNLEMSGATTAKLIAKGERAAALLIERFAPEENDGPSHGFKRHARVRNRVLVRSMIEFARDWRMARLRSAPDLAHAAENCLNAQRVHHAIDDIARRAGRSTCGVRCKACGSMGSVQRLMLTGDRQSTPPSEVGSSSLSGVGDETDIRK